MNKAYRSYSDHEIANFVLGVELPNNIAQGIQHNLASDDASAARALKWEAYFLSLADGLKPVTVPDDIFNNIQSSLNIKIANTDDNSDFVTKPATENLIQAEPTPKKPKQKFRLIVGAIALLIVFFLTWASLKAPIEQTVTQQTVDLVN